MNIAIVDDLQNEIDNLKSILTEYGVAIDVKFTTECFSCGEDFLEKYTPFQYTVIFLEIYMEGMTGIEVAEKIRKTDSDSLIIFLTTSSEHMGSAFSIHAYDYIEKPAKKEKIFQVMDDILKRHTKIYEKTLEFICDKETIILPVSNIVSIRTAESNYLEIIDRENHVYHTRMTFSNLQKEMETESAFLLINRGVLVNMEYIVRFADGKCVMKNRMQFQAFTKRGFETEQKWQNYIFTKVRDKQRDTRKAKFKAENEAEDEND